jgi:thiol-disulfide isomerase/thioredoxin
MMNYLNKIPSILNIQYGGGLTNLSTNSIMIFMAVIIFIIIGFSYYYFYLRPIMKATYRANDGVNNGNSNDESNAYAELLLFSADWCPHCKTAKPIFTDFSIQHKNKAINGYVVQFTEINCTNESNESSKLMDKYNVEGFPTIKLLMNGQIIEFDAKPTKENLTQFLNTVLR